MFLSGELQKRKIPALLCFNDGTPVKEVNSWAARRKEVIDILCQEVYGVMPKAPKGVEAKLIECAENAFAGKAVWSKLEISFETGRGEFAFPLNLIIPKNIENPPLILHIAFRTDIPDRYYPAEEIIDNGFAVAAFCYQDISADVDDSFSSGIAAMYNSGAREKNEWGKIGMWAFAASRVMDYLQTREDIDKDSIAVMGHSRLGKTALLAGALDERFAFVISNNSGCGGAAITRKKTGEHIEDSCKKFAYWYCENYKKYIDNEENIPFDQHFLLAAIAPRYLYVASAKEDTWADPNSEYLACTAADSVYKLYSKAGFVHPDSYPSEGDSFFDGEIGYHLRSGTHFLSRYDWNRFMEYITKHRRKGRSENDD